MLRRFDLDILTCRPSDWNRLKRAVHIYSWSRGKQLQEFGMQNAVADQTVSCMHRLTTS
jgi:hypothetical protein